MEYPKFKVCCMCFTFNQAKYITDAMNGFTMQQTDFPFVCTIVDDASTDGEQEVIRKYVEENFDFSEGSAAYSKETDYAFITYAQHKTNKNCYFAVLYLKENHFSQRKNKNLYLKEWLDTARYVATCEGDDYWTVNNKLQKQVDFLDSHPNYVICSHTYDNLIENDHVIRKNNYFSRLRYMRDKEFEYYKITLDNYWKVWVTQPLSCMVRGYSEIQNQIPRNKYKLLYDVIFYYYVIKQGKGALLSDNMGVYRINEGGIWSGKSNIQRYKLKMSQMLNIYKVEEDIRCLFELPKMFSLLMCQYIKQFQISNLVDDLKYYSKQVPNKYILKGICFIPLQFVLIILKKIKMIITR